ncbi:MAG: hypothetical protein ACPG5Z_00115 [Pseudoalteromonas sp.]
MTKKSAAQRMSIFLDKNPAFTQALVSVAKETIKPEPEYSNTNDEESFLELPLDVRFAGQEYYALINKQNKGTNLTDQERQRVFELLPVICDYNLTASHCGIEL